MKARTIIGAALLIMGLFLAICTMDGSQHELAARFTGVAMVLIGAITGDFFSNQKNSKKYADESKK